MIGLAIQWIEEENNERCNCQTSILRYSYWLLLFATASRPNLVNYSIYKIVRDLHHMTSLVGHAPPGCSRPLDCGPSAFLALLPGPAAPYLQA